ncbi:hypothetical protein ACQY0O_006309 [Thecaphora frezii]
MDQLAAAAEDEGPDAYYPTPPQVNLERWLKAGRPPLLASYRCPSTSRTHPRKKAKLDHFAAERLAGSACPHASNFWRRAKWSPDGSSILAQSESHEVSVLHMVASATDPFSPSAGASDNGGQLPEGGNGAKQSPLQLSLEASFRSPSPVLDAVWYPLPAYETVERAADPPRSSNRDDDAELGPARPEQSYRVSWCYAQSCRDLPTRLVDSSNGSTKASYGVMNQTERFVGPHSLAFSPDHSRLYCGEWSQISILPLSLPGLNTHSRLPLIESRSASTAAGEGQRGFVSALAVAPLPTDGSGDDSASLGSHDLLACGTFSGTIGLYAIDPARLPPPQPYNAPLRSSPRYLQAASACVAGWRLPDGNGIHQLAFHPLSPHVLFVASRKSNAIHVYDTRYLVGDPAKLSFPPLQAAAVAATTAKRKRCGGGGGNDGAERNGALLATLPRATGASHQRFWFDVDWAGRMLATGDAQGCISIWKIDVGRFVDQEEEGDNATEGLDAQVQGARVHIEPTLKWKAHEDAVGSVSFHPHQPLLLSVSGSRHWPPADSESGSSATSSPRGSRSPSAEASEALKEAWYATDSSMKAWDLG